MASAVERADRRTETEISVVLLAEAETIAAAILLEASNEASDLLAARARDNANIDRLASSQAVATRSIAARRAQGVVAAPSAEAVEELAAARVRSRNMALAAARECQLKRRTAAAVARLLVDEADQRAEDLRRAAVLRGTELLAAAQQGAAELVARAESDAAGSVAQARRALEEAARARAEAEREAATTRQTAAALAAEITEAARQDLKVAQRVLTLEQRGASHVALTAMREASETLGGALRQLDSAIELRTFEERRFQPEPAVGVRPAPAMTLAPAARPTEAPAPPVEPEAEPESPDSAGMPLLVPILPMGRELVLRLMVLAGGATTAWFWLWWLNTGHGAWTAGSATATALLSWVFCLTGYYFFFICRMTRPNPDLPVPDLRVAMVVTKAPGEAWDVLQATLEAMLAQELGRPYDVWLADERPALETVQWCLDHDVKVSSRYGVAEYHRPTWPRRTKSKEGNLAYFYDHVGYKRYDVVAQLDADHVPTPSYLQEVVRPFIDPRVGYVAAPSICDANADAGWTVRGRLYREAAVHGPVQAGSNGGYAPVCIGSHYAVRTAALADVGGLGPELAEDYTTTLWLQSGGWDGVFSIDALAHGDGPATVQEMLVQELQWSRSLCTILVRWAPTRLRAVQWRALARMMFALLFYPIHVLVLGAAAVVPIAAVLLHAPWGNTTLAGFYIHLWPTSVVGLATLVLLRRSGLLRPAGAKIWSWERMAFQLVSWPWVLMGFLQGVYSGLRSSVVAFKVTPKALKGPQPLAARYVIPTLVLGAVPAWVVVVVRDSGPATGLLLLLTFQALAYFSCASLAVVTHLTANRRRSAPLPGGSGAVSPWRAGGSAASTVAAVVIPSVSALIWRFWAVGLSF
ncbi:MAG: glycosyltransferase family 2 protein [Acidimicrobiales bacterium]